jgi:HEAT repeat protein
MCFQEAGRLFAMLSPLPGKRRSLARTLALTGIAALLVSCGATPPRDAPSGILPGTSSVPRDDEETIDFPDPAELGALRASPEYWVLASAAEFRGTVIGEAAKVSDEVTAFRRVLGSPQADLVFLDLLRTAKLPGRLYALCGLRLVDPDRYARAARPYLEMEREVGICLYGPDIGSLPVKELVRSTHPRAVQLGGPEDTLEAFCGRQGIPFGAVMLILDIDGGGIPADFRDDPGPDRPGPDGAGDPETVDGAIEALLEMGEGAVPDLEIALGDPDPRIRAMAARVLGDLGPAGVGPGALEVGALLGGLISDPSPEVCEEAFEALVSLGAWAAGAAPAIHGSLQGKASKEEVLDLCGLLATMGPAAVPHLADLLDLPGARIPALEALRAIGPFAAGALDRVASHLADEDPEARRRAALAVAGLCSGSGDLAAEAGAVASLLPALRDPEPRVRAAAARALASMGEAARPALDALRALRDDADPAARFSSAAALWRIGREATGAVAACLEAEAAGGAPKPDGIWVWLSPWDEGLKPFDLLREIAGASPEAFQELHAAAGDPASPSRAAAIEALGAIGPGAMEAIPVLREAAGSEDGGAALPAAEAIWKISGDAGPAVRILVVILERGPAEDRPEAAFRLGRLGLRARDAVPALEEAVESQDRPLCRAAIDALGSIGPEAAPAARALASRIKDIDPWMRAAALDALGQIGPRARLALAAARRAMHDPDAEVRWAARVAVARIEGRPERL